MKGKSWSFEVSFRRESLLRTEKEAKQIYLFSWILFNNIFRNTHNKSIVELFSLKKWYLYFSLLLVKEGNKTVITPPTGQEITASNKRTWIQPKDESSV